MHPFRLWLLLFSLISSTRGYPQRITTPAFGAHAIFERDLGSDFAQVLDTFLSEPTCSASFQDGMSLGDPSSDTPPNSNNGGQQLAIASYINPLADPDAWPRLIGYPTEKLSILVASVVNGPDVASDHNWASVIEEASFRVETVIGYVAKDLRKIWHIIYNVPESEVGRVAKLARERGAGLLEIPNDIMPNPYDNLPGESCMKAQMDAVEGGKPLNEDPDPFPTSGGVAATPQGLGAGSTDFSSTHLTWDASSFAIGYEIFIGESPSLIGCGSVVASVPAYMTVIVLGNLSPGTSYTFHVAAIGAGGIRSALSSKVIVQTMALPDGMTVIDHKSTPSTTSTVVQANILVPYAFVRVYIWDSIECDWETNPGWPVNFASANYVCTHYMVEGETLYKYNGKPSLPFTNAPWSWESIGSVPITTNSYRTTWTLPIGLSTTDTSKFLIQTQGYAPAEVVSKPDPSKYDCSGSSMCSSSGQILKYCDQAVNSLVRDDTLTYGTFGDRNSGNCKGAGAQACGVFLKGDGYDCEISGNNMWFAYQNIREIGGCKKCGSYDLGNGCKVVIDYVTGC
ncbi:hypothetical protein CSOJ01_10621 [Colletotrichum sojae]|uniref:Fibronectin type-III domain-containing protein n=1 Tax=Colletotrichum sojae TaxID=2175907 RepID=A0A8H6MP02_9PEZI|nr:hypothetical protein CSOJ01_10621 [Colletotrichum sojae]